MLPIFLYVLFVGDHKHFFSLDEIFDECAHSGTRRATPKYLRTMKGCILHLYSRVYETRAFSS